jgi:arsenite methyltransferase
MNPTPKQSSQKPNYGIDAPGLVRLFFAASLIAALLTIIILWLVPAWRLPLATLTSLAALYLLGMGSLMLVWSKIIKLKTRDTILDHIPWRGDEQVLDIGCGRGLLLIGAAKRLTSGKATGIDIWQATDQSGNTERATRENARIEGVESRITIDTGDMRNLPYPNESFDVITSHWVVHNLASEKDRNQSLAEMHRVLKPQGHLILADIEHRDHYTQHLKALGFKSIEVIVHPTTDKILRTISAGSFGPATHYAVK